MLAHRILSYGFRLLGGGTQVEFFKALREATLESEAIALLNEKCRRRGLNRALGEEVLRGIENLDRLSWQITFPGAPDFPQSLLRLPDCPLYLSYRGSPFWRELPSLSVVGGREPSLEALNWMEKELGEVLRKRKILIASGGARGIDQKAHSLALLCEAPTSIFLPSGAKSLYPATLQNWLEPVVEAGGAFISEYPPEMPMRKIHFQERNRLIAGFSNALLVVQCRERSGSLITANAALQLGVPVGAVPWSPLENRATGSNRLIYDGAQMIRDALDIEIYMNSIPNSTY